MYAWYHCIMFCLTTLRFAWQPNWFNYEGITLEAVRPIFDPNILLYFYNAHDFTPFGGGSEQVNKSRNMRSRRRVRSANICGGRKLHKYVSTNVWTHEKCQHTANVTECTLYDATIQDRCVALVIFVLETSMVGCHVTNRWAWSAVTWPIAERSCQVTGDQLFG